MRKKSDDKEHKIKKPKEPKNATYNHSPTRQKISQRVKTLKKYYKTEQHKIHNQSIGILYLKKKNMIKKRRNQKKTNIKKILQITTINK